MPELKEYERKKIFTREEISSISRQRSNFEHKINARGSTPSDYARYAEFETNVEALRKKRIKRMGVKATNHSGQRRIFFVFERGTKKHPGDVGLWLLYIDFAKKSKAHKKLARIFTDVLRLHPARPELWIYAAQFAVEENGDMTEARGYMQRGLRFCKNKQEMWLQYLRLEMSYIAKLQARRQILGISEPQEDPKDSVKTDSQLDSIESVGDSTVDTIASTAASTSTRSVTAGAIPIAIFDSAMQQFHDDPKLVFKVVDLISEYTNLAAAANVLHHIREHLSSVNESVPAASACEILLPLCGLTVESQEFPSALRIAIKKLKSSPQSSQLRVWAKSWLERLVLEDGLDPALKQVASGVSKSLSASNTT